MTSTKMTIAAKKMWVAEQLKVTRNVELAVVAIFKRQTADEQATNSTNNNNSRGFTGFDAQFGSSLAKGIMKYGKLLPGQVPYARKIIGKYWKQLIEVAETKRRTTGRGGAPWVETSPSNDHMTRYETDAEYRAMVDAQENEKERRKASYDYGCQFCGDPDFHDGEQCPKDPLYCAEEV